jgi:hypothetical protein
MSKISEFITVSSPALTALIPIVELPVTQGNPSVNKKISLSDLKARLANIGNFTFSANDASLPLGNNMTLSTYQNGGNKESRLTLSTSGISSLDVGNNLRITIGYGTGFEKVWTFGATGTLTLPDASIFSGTGDITFSGNEIRSINSHVKLVANSDSVNRRVLQLYTDGTVEVPVGAVGAGLVQSAAGLWLSANGSQLKLSSNGSIDLPVVNSTTSLIRTASVDTTINSNGQEWLFSRTGSLTVPGIIIHPTVDKNNNFSLLATAVLESTFNLNWTDGQYNITWGGGGSGTITISEGSAGLLITTPGTSSWSELDTLTTVYGNTLGGVTGTDDIVITVSTIGPTNIDLTKTVNKLIEGNYYLDDGVEGQMMYLVSHPTMVVPGNVYVTVDSSRINTEAYTMQTLNPFFGGGVCTLLYTAGSWQLVSGGNWAT